MSSVKKNVKKKSNSKTVASSKPKAHRPKVSVNKKTAVSKTLPKDVELDIDPIDEYIEDMSTPVESLEGSIEDYEFFGDDDTVYPAD